MWFGVCLRRTPRLQLMSECGHGRAQGRLKNALCYYGALTDCADEVLEVTFGNTLLPFVSCALRYGYNIVDVLSCGEGGIFLHRLVAMSQRKDNHRYLDCARVPVLLKIGCLE